MTAPSDIAITQDNTAVSGSVLRLVVVLRELSRIAEQTDIRITIHHTGRVQIYDFGSNDDDFEADDLTPDDAAAKLDAALADRSEVIIHHDPTQPRE